MIAENLSRYSEAKISVPARLVLVNPQTDLGKAERENPWLTETPLVVKPDQLFGKRREYNFVLLNASFEQAMGFIEKNMGRDVTIGKITGKLTHFLIEPFIPHREEYYVAMKSDREGDTIYFSTMGGVDIEENWENVVSLHIPTMDSINGYNLKDTIFSSLPKDKKKLVSDFVKALFKFYIDFDFVYLEINPFTFSGNSIIPLDVMARLDDTSAFKDAFKWGELEFPAPFGRKLTPEEQIVADLDRRSGASLKLTILNKKGRIWTLVAGGGASIIYADTITDLGFGKELANYGEYSGNPSEEETYQYTKIVLDLMTREKDPHGLGKILLIGGGIANFTDVANTFKGIVHALNDFAEKLRENDVRIYVRRGGPNYEEGLRMMRKLGEVLGVPTEVYGPETHMTKIVSLALKSEG